MVSHDHHIVSLRIYQRYAIIKVFTTVLRSLHDEVDRICFCILGLEDVFLRICSYIKIVTELCLVLWKGYERRSKCRSHETAMVRAVRSHSTE